MVQGPERCLLCYKPCTSDAFAAEQLTNCSGGGGGPLINRELYTLFVLRNILDVPEQMLEEFLEENGEPSNSKNPSEMVAVCKECREVVEGARGIYKQILRAQRRFRKARGEVIQRLRRSLKAQKGKGIRSYSQKEGMRVTEEIRQFVDKSKW